ncbi:hypothetical protein AAFF_G00360400 [Aldrovandia affinis]|uniref:Uncharacterized protein n=1 Tax=Aldrovandia affinis TaxID=143900 RepID=A0AAD7WP29_9TELE|nr:hypothetical protein AAFF_G00360400 [Aldrovandia affinis]
MTRLVPGRSLGLQRAWPLTPAAPDATTRSERNARPPWYDSSAQTKLPVPSDLGVTLNYHATCAARSKLTDSVTVHLRTRAAADDEGWQRRSPGPQNERVYSSARARLGDRRDGGVQSRPGGGRAGQPGFAA